MSLNCFCFFIFICCMISVQFKDLHSKHHKHSWSIIVYSIASKATEVRKCSFNFVGFLFKVLTAQDLVDFSPVYRCLHIYTVLVIPSISFTTNVPCTQWTTNISTAYLHNMLWKSVWVLQQNTICVLLRNIPVDLFLVDSALSLKGFSLKVAPRTLMAYISKGISRVLTVVPSILSLL